MNFPDWLDTELAYRGWSRMDLVRRSGLSSGTISNIFAGHRNAGVDTCRAIAKALRLPEADVLRAAGLLAPDPASDPVIEEILQLAASLPDDDQQTLIDLARTLIERREREAARRSTKPAE